MRKYCKAHYLKDLRQFHAWTEKRGENEEALSDVAVVYLWDDFTVVRSPIISDKGLLFDDVTPEWQAFCQETLHFELPDDLRYVYDQDQKQQPSFELSPEELNNIPPV